MMTNTRVKGMRTFKIVVRGYEDLYDWLTDGFDKTVPSEVTQFVLMFLIFTEH